jgi:hypothetical protein
MKIIKRGALQSELNVNVICKSCNSELEYQRLDIKRDRDGKYIVCPVCLHLIGVE